MNDQDIWHFIRRQKRGKISYAIHMANRWGFTDQTRYAKKFTSKEAAQKQAKENGWTGEEYDICWVGRRFLADSVVE